MLRFFCIPSSSATSVRSTTRSPGWSTTPARSRRSDASPRSTSMTRTPSGLKMSTSSTCRPIRAESSGSATSVKYFILRRSVSSAPIVSRVGRRRGPNRVMNTAPATTSARPRGAISNIEKGASPWPRATPSTSRLVDVPIRVIMPPRMVK